MTPNKTLGFTLVELLVVVAIAGILLSASAWTMNRIISKTHRTSTANNLITFLTRARHSAIQEQTIVTVCPLDSQRRCTKDWRLPITAFRDPGSLKKVSSADDVLQVLETSRGRLIARSGNRAYFRFRPSGFAREAIGNIIWCDVDNNEANAFQVRINMGGRAMFARDTNNDGVVEDAYGNPIRCPVN